MEALYRFYNFGWDSFSIRKVNSFNAMGKMGLLRPADDLEVVYELKPNMKTIFKFVPFETNAQGLRDKEYAIEKPRNTFRVAVIGDSYTMASGIKIEDAYHSLLEKRLNEEGKGSSYEFINFGVGGYSLRQYLGSLNTQAKKYDPDLVLVGFCPENDHHVQSHLIHQYRYKVKKRTYTFFRPLTIIKLRDIKRSFVNNYKKHKKETAEKRESVNSSNKRDEVKKVFTKLQKKYILHNFLKMGQFSQKNDVPVVIVFISHIINEKYSLMSDEVKRMALMNDLHFVETATSFKDTKLKDYVILPVDDHPNEKANIIFADRIQEYLKEKDLLR